MAPAREGSPDTGHVTGMQASPSPHSSWRPHAPRSNPPPSRRNGPSYQARGLPPASARSSFPDERGGRSRGILPLQAQGQSPPSSRAAPGRSSRALPCRSLFVVGTRPYEWPRARAGAWGPASAASAPPPPRSSWTLGLGRSRGRARRPRGAEPWLQPLAGPRSPLCVRRVLIGRRGAG